MEEVLLIARNVLLRQRSGAAPPPVERPTIPANSMDWGDPSSPLDFGDPFGTIATWG